MKVILLEDVYKKGVAGEVVDVAPGYARNYLIPQGLAVKATPGALRQMENLRAKADVRRAERDQEYGQIAERIEQLKLYFGVKAGETGKLYGSVTPADIAEQLGAEIGMEIDRRRVGDRPLRELGETSVPVRLDTGLTPNVGVVIFREGEDPRLEEIEDVATGEDDEVDVEDVADEFVWEAEAESLDDEVAAPVNDAELEAELQAEEESPPGEEAFDEE